MGWLPEERPWTASDALRVGFGAFAILLGVVYLGAWLQTFHAATKEVEWQKDWWTLRVAADQFLHGRWGELYTRDFSGARFCWLYPPFALWIVAPLALLPATGAYVAIVAVQSAATFAAVRLLGDDRDHDGITALAATMGSAAFVSMLIIGQNSGVLALIASGSAMALVAGNEVLAGALIGLLVVKPNWLAPFALLLLLRGRWRALAAVAAVCVLALLSTLPMGLEVWRDFLVSSQGYVAVVSKVFPTWKMITLHAFWRSVAPTALVWPLWVASELAVLFAFATSILAECDPRRQVGITVLLLVAANLYVNWYDGLVLLVPAIVWWNERDTYPSLSRWTIGACIVGIWLWQWASAFVIQGSIPLAPVGALAAIWLAAEAVETRRKAGAPALTQRRAGG